MTTTVIRSLAWDVGSISICPSVLQACASHACTRSNVRFTADFKLFYAQVRLRLLHASTSTSTFSSDIMGWLRELPELLTRFRPRAHTSFCYPTPYTCCQPSHLQEPAGQRRHVGGNSTDTVLQRRQQLVWRRASGGQQRGPTWQQRGQVLGGCS
jgi:hypothetical protein